METSDSSMKTARSMPESAMAFSWLSPMSAAPGELITTASEGFFPEMCSKPSLTL